MWVRGVVVVPLLLLLLVVVLLHPANARSFLASSDAGADPSAATFMMKTPLYYAAEKNHVEVCCFVFC